jgi:hypothetical protein
VILRLELAVEKRKMVHPFRFEEKQKMEEKMGDEQPVLNWNWTDHRPDSKRKKKRERE